MLRNIAVYLTESLKEKVSKKTQCSSSEFGKDREVSESLSHVLLFATPWTIQSLEFCKPEYWSW